MASTSSENDVFHDNWTINVETAILTAVQALLRVDPNPTSIDSYSKLNEIISVLCPEEHPGSIAIKQKIRLYKTIYDTVTRMGNSGFRIYPSSVYGTAHQWRDWLQMNPADCWIRSQWIPFLDWLRRMFDPVFHEPSNQVLQLHNHSDISFRQGQWTERMEICLIASMEAVVTIDQNFDCLANYGRLEKLYNILCPATNLGSLAIKARVRNLRRNEGIITLMLNNEFAFNYQTNTLSGTDQQWDAWTEQRKHHIWYRDRSFPYYPWLRNICGNIIKAQYNGEDYSDGEVDWDFCASEPSF